MLIAVCPSNTVLNGTWQSLGLGVVVTASIRVWLESGLILGLGVGVGLILGSVFEPVLAPGWVYITSAEMPFVRG